MSVISVCSGMYIEHRTYKLMKKQQNNKGGEL